MSRKQINLHPLTRTLATLGLAIGLALSTNAARASSGWLDLSSVTGGDFTVPGGFVGTLNGVAVTGSLSGPGDQINIFDAGLDAWESTIDGSSPQYGYSGIYTPSQNNVDRVGYGNNLNPANAASRLTISFGQPMTDVTLHVANLDGSVLDFTPTTGLIGLSLLSGNGGSGDGLDVSGNQVLDLDSNSIVSHDQTLPPPTSDPRSAYGSVLLQGTYSALVFDIYTNPLNTIGGADGGSFTLSAPVPIPAAFWLFGSALAGLGVIGKRRR